MQSLGTREEYYVWVCYEASSPNFFWRIFIFAYLGVLQIVGIVLAFQTRKVNVPGLKDSKFVAGVVYISSVVLVALALVTFALRSYINISSGMNVVGIFSMTTIFLILIFIPKVIANLDIRLLYAAEKLYCYGTVTVFNVYASIHIISILLDGASLS